MDPSELYRAKITAIINSMNSKFVRALLLSLTIILTFIWTSNPSLNIYNLQATGALIVLYFVSRFIFRRVSNTFFFAALILVSVSLLLIFSTGGVNSPIFFVLNFLIFAIALLIAPSQAAVATITLAVIFIWESYSTLNTQTIINILSLVLITPIAMIFSKTYLKNLQSEGKITVLKEAIKDEHTNSLLWISTTAKPSIATVLNSVSDIVIYLNTVNQKLNLPAALTEKMKTVQKDLISLYASTGTLKESIEESSDRMEL